VIARYWLVQGMVYTNWTERAHRLTVEAVLILLAWWASGFAFVGRGQVVVAVLIGHTASMILNGHLFALFKHDLYWFGFYDRWDEFSAYVDRLHQRLVRRPCPGLDRAEAYGSLARGDFSATSDLDLRFIARPGFLNGWRVAHRVFEERLRALFAGFPIDAYMFHSEAELARKMNVAAEKPWVIFPGPFQLPQRPEIDSEGARQGNAVLHTE
jgi:predicted nucleotidyltransferase